MNRITVIVGAVCAALGVFVGYLVFSQPETAAQGKIRQPVKAVKHALPGGFQAGITVSFSGAPMKDALETIFAKADVQWTADADLSNSPGVNIDIKEPKELDAVLSEVLPPAGLAVEKNEYTGIYHVRQKNPEASAEIPPVFMPAPPAAEKAAAIVPESTGVPVSGAAAAFAAESGSEAVKAAAAVVPPASAAVSPSVAQIAIETNEPSINAETGRPAEPAAARGMDPRISIALAATPLSDALDLIFIKADISWIRDAGLDLSAYPAVTIGVGEPVELSRVLLDVLSPLGLAAEPDASGGIYRIKKRGEAGKQ